MGPGGRQGGVDGGEASESDRKSCRPRQGVRGLSRGDGEPWKGFELGSDVIGLVFCKNRPLPTTRRHPEEGRVDGEQGRVSANYSHGPDPACCLACP